MNQQTKFHMVTGKTLVVGIDIAKHKHWVQCINYRGEVVSQAFPFKNNKTGFKSLLERLKVLKEKNGFKNILIGVEPTGHYWKCLAYDLLKVDIPVVLVNTSHVKRSKEFDDNSPSKNDPKDALIIARLVKDARFTVPQIVTGIYADLRNLCNQRNRTVKKVTRVKIQLHTSIDIYFPEFFTVFKKIDGVSARAALKHFPLPQDILKLSNEEIKTCLKKYNKSSKVNDKLVQKLKHAAVSSVGVKEGIQSAGMEIVSLIEEWEFYQRQLAQIEESIKEILKQIKFVPFLLAVKGLGVISIANLLAETGDLLKYKHWKQIRKLAGLNLVKQSSGMKEGVSQISKRGRSKLRSTLYLMARVVSSKNKEFKAIFKHLKSRPDNPLTGNEALIAIASKLLRVIHAISKSKVQYDPQKLLLQIKKVEPAA